MAKAKPLTEPEPPRIDMNEPDPIPEPLPEIPVIAPMAPPRRSGFLGTVAGGAIAAALGFGLALYLLPQGWQGQQSDTAALIAEQSARMDALQVDIAKLATTPDPRVEKIATDVTALQTAIAALPQSDGAPDARMTALDQRLTAIEALPMGDGGITPAALAALRADIAALKTQSQSQTGAGNDLIAQVEAAAKAAEERLTAAQTQAQALQIQAQVTAALGRVQSGLDSGAAFAPALTDLVTAGLTIPDALTSVAEKGLPTLTTLQTGFPDAARAALEASLRANPGAGWADRLGTFLQSQTGARSLTPQEGTDPDAVLSRAEDALRRGDLPVVLTELATLAPAGQAAMADWITLAQTRISATDALTTLIGAQP